MIQNLNMKKTRRTFLKNSGKTAMGIGVLGLSACNTTKKPMVDTTPMIKEDANATKELFFKISLAQWSLNKALFAKEMDNLDFAKVAKTQFGIDGIEYVNQFFKDHVKDNKYLNEMKKRADDHGVKSLIIMVDGEGGLAEPNDKERNKAVENHYKWVDAAKYLGCHSIRVNSFGKGSSEDVQKASIDGLGKLSEYARPLGMNVIVENHGGYSSDGKWLSDVMRSVHQPNCGTLPDFGNFCLERVGGVQWGAKCIKDYDKYKGVEELMPFAKAVSAKSYAFDAEGNETTIDFMRMLKIVKSFNYTGYVGVEYEGKKLSEHDGIMATKKLLEKVGRQLG